jgi:drug/metabolite transporter (DMT)-like permease
MREGAYAFGPFATAWVRVTLAAIMLTPVLLWRQELPMFRANWQHSLMSGLLNAGIPFACYAYALLHLSTGLSSILNATTPLFGALVARVWLGERLSVSRALGLGLGFGGVALLASHVSGDLSFQPEGMGLAMAACLLATFCYGVAGSYTQRFLKGASAMVTSTGSLWGASLGLLLPGLYFWPEHHIPLRAWAALGIAGFFCTALAYVLYFRLMAKTGPARAMTVTYLIPVFANLMGVILLDETVTTWMMGCAVLIVLGTALASGLIGRR